MANHGILFYAVIIFIAVYCLYVYYEMDTFSLKCVISDVDGNRYCVRDRKDLSETADLLANVTNKCKALVSYVDKKYKIEFKNFDFERVKKILMSYDFSEERIESQFDKLRQVKEASKQKTLF